MRRHKRKLLALAGLVLAGALAFALWPRPDRITRQNFDRIRVGMSRMEVAAMLGPTGVYEEGDREYDFVREEEQTLGDLSALAEDFARRRERWDSDRAIIWVLFDPAGNVTHAMYSPVKLIDRGPLGNLRWRAERQWRKWFPKPPIIDEAGLPLPGPD